MVEVGLWVPDPESDAAPTRAFQWTAEALDEHKEVDVRVGSPQACTWDVDSVFASSPSELADKVSIIHWNHLMDLEFPRLIDAKTVLTYHGDVQWSEPGLNYGSHPYIRSIKERIADVLKLWQYDAVCFVSNDLRERMNQRLSWIPNHQLTTYNGLPPHINPDAPPAREEPYLFHVSEYGRRKNPEGILEGYKMADIDIPLVVAGKGWNKVDAVESLGFVPDEEISSWYTGAEAFLFPSKHECFGLPIIESIACGTPVVTSNRYAMPEVAKGEAFLCDPDSPEEIGAAINEAVEATQTKKVLFDWAKTAEDLAQLYKKL